MASILSGINEGVAFGPPREKRSARAFVLAIIAHLLLLGALTWGVNWKRSDPAASFEAELWSAVPQQAAPRAVEPPPPPPPPPTPTPPAPTPPAPRPAPEPPKVSPTTPDVDIALEQEKKRKLLQKQKDADAKKLEEREERVKRDNQEKVELQAKKEKEKEKELKTKEDVAKRKAAEEVKKAEARQEAKDLENLQQQKQAEAAAKQRQENMARLNAQLGATGDANSTGTAQKSSGPSAGYGGRVRAKVKPNVLFTDDITGNPSAEVEVRTTPDGTIVSQRLVKSSGNKAWDDAVIKAIIRTETMPRDVDGKVPTPMILEFRPKELL